ncbi:MAG TPA: GNAT family N-acetyltransferase [Solirubrobacteraceae bacterium]|nr:GNAT family N-acetyltransferase [Solirubrobacteraceae bacterium]
MPSLIEPVVAAGALAARTQPVIDGYGLRLRPWRDADVPALIAAYADPEIARWHARTLADEREARAWLAERERGRERETAIDWAIVDPDDDHTPLGRAGLNQLDLAEGVGEVAYWVAPEHRGANVGARATCVLADWAFDELGLHRLGLLHSIGNEGSCRVADRALFRYEGTLRGHALHGDGWHDMHVHGRLADDPRPTFTERTASRARPR